MKRFILGLSSILLICSPASGQIAKKFFYNSKGQPADSAESYFYRVGKKKKINSTVQKIGAREQNQKSNAVDTNLDTVWSYYTKSGNKKSRATFNVMGQHGAYVSWFENGNVSEKGVYFNGHPAVYRIKNYPNGQGMATYEFESGSSNEKLVNYWDSLGNPLVTNGTGRCRCYERSDDVLYRNDGKIVRGIKDSVWSTWRNDTLLYRETFEKGQLKGGTSFAEGGQQHYLAIDEQPEFVGGLPALGKFIQKNLHYPSSARRKGIEGKVFVQFIVASDGSITDVQTIKGISEDCDLESERVVSIMPDWNPGTRHGEPVSVKYVLPISFRLTGPPRIK